MGYEVSSKGSRNPSDKGGGSTNGRGVAAKSAARPNRPENPGKARQLRDMERAKKPQMFCMARSSDRSVPEI